MTTGWSLVHRLVSLITCSNSEDRKMNLLDTMGDDILVMILARLPAKQIVRCSVVCRRWQSLIYNNNNPAFLGMLISKEEPELFYLNRAYRTEEVWILDWDRVRKSRPKKDVFRKTQLNVYRLGHAMTPEVVGGCNGLLVFGLEYELDIWRPSTHWICNPTTNEMVTLGEIVCCRGIYFHLPTSTYRLLCCINLLAAGEGWRIRYYSCGLDLVELNKEIAVLPFVPSVSSKAIDGFIYWLALGGSCGQSIIMFDTETEEMQLMPHPDDDDQVNGVFCQKFKYLVEMTDRLCYGRVKGKDFESVELWILEDCSSWTWVNKFNIDVNRLVRYRSPYDVEDFGNVQPLVIRDGILLLTCWSNVFAYRLASNKGNKLVGGGKPLEFMGFFNVAEVPPTHVILSLKRSFISPHHLHSTFTS